ncbi:hypothetical protein K1X76_08835, partial [bacterium]|nr:hypothetical protein [bacterium]
WSWNPNSGDTGGILKDDWKTVNCEKYQNLRRLMSYCSGDTNIGMESCSSSTPTPVCGNGTVEAGEQCDDRNTVSGDGCSSSCQTETPPPSANLTCTAKVRVEGSWPEGSNYKANIVTQITVNGQSLGNNFTMKYINPSYINKTNAWGWDPALISGGMSGRGTYINLNNGVKSEDLGISLIGSSSALKPQQVLINDTLCTMQ